MANRLFHRRNTRVVTAFLLMAWLLPIGLWGCERFFNPIYDYADQGITGPYAVRATDKVVNGRTTYEIIGPIAVVHGGQRFGWVSTVCLEAGKSMDAHADLVRVSDGRVVVSGPHRFWSPDDRRCGPAVGSMIMPTDTVDGEFELRRTGVVRPDSLFPLKTRLTSFRFHAVAADAGTKPAP